MTQISYQENWGISSAGRAPALQAGGRRFDPVILHHSFDSIAYLIAVWVEFNIKALLIESVLMLIGIYRSTSGLRIATAVL